MTSPVTLDAAAARASGRAIDGAGVEHRAAAQIAAATAGRCRMKGIRLNGQVTCLRPGGAVPATPPRIFGRCHIGSTPPGDEFGRATRKFAIANL